jgi:hypothetical protein
MRFWKLLELELELFFLHMELGRELLELNIDTHVEFRVLLVLENHRFFMFLILICIFKTIYLMKKHGFVLCIYCVLGF